MVSTEKRPNVIIRAINEVKTVNITKQASIEYRSLKALKLHLAPAIEDAGGRQTSNTVKYRA